MDPVRRVLERGPAWAGHSVEMLLRVYARCVAGLEDVWIARMEATLRGVEAGDPEEPR
jgi:hypothetical protein